MSKEKRTIEIEPPGIHGTAERLVSTGHTCGYCHGNGWFWGEDETKEDVKVPCPICQGKREVDAVIDIHWFPTKNR